MMSGTSLDAIDVALVELSRDQDDPATVQGRVLHHGEHPWPAQLRRDLLAVLPPSTSDVGTWCRLHAQVGDAFADAARATLNDALDTMLSSTYGAAIVTGDRDEYHGVVTFEAVTDHVRRTNREAEERRDDTGGPQGRTDAAQEES